MNPVCYTWTPCTGTEICKAITATEAKDLSFNGDLATNLISGQPIVLDKISKRIAISSTSNNSTVKFKIFGSGMVGKDITETITGVNNNVVYSGYWYKTIKKIQVDQALTGSVNIGFGIDATGIAGYTDWFPVDLFKSVLNIGLFVNIDMGSVVKYTLEATMQEVDNFSEIIFYPLSNMESATTNMFEQLSIPCRFLRFAVDGGTDNNAQISFYIAQQGVS